MRADEKETFSILQTMKENWELRAERLEEQRQFKTENKDFCKN